MNSRLNLQDMVNLLAAQTGKSKKDTERFLRTFIAVVSEGVFKDRIVKVKGLGTFKIISVEKRESIDVNTGKRFVIPEHYKFNFSPDKDLKELVNKPFSFFETTEVNDGADFSEIIAGDETTDQSEETVSPPEDIIPEKEESSATEEHVPVSIEQESETPLIESEEAEPPVTSKDDSITTPPIKEENTLKVKKKPSSQKGVIIGAILLAVVLGVIGFFFFNKQTPSGKETEQTTLPMTSDLPVDVTITEDTSQVNMQTDNAGTVAPEPEILATVSIEPGSRLTLIALEYYKHKVFWVYLYEHNKAKISDPNNVPIGTEIVIPNPKTYGIDAADRASLDKATALQTQILSGDK